MKKILMVMISLLLLAGCSVETFETVDDGNDVQAMAKPASLLVDIPENAAVPAMQGASGTLYFCGDYDIMVEVVPSGDLGNTLQTLTGFRMEDLEMIHTQRCGVDCYEGAWSAAGEAGDHVGRVMVLDDGSFHYCISLMAMAEDSGACAEEWATVINSVALGES